MNLDISLHHRNIVIKLQSLIHFQFSADRYKSMINYAWFKSGYTNERGPLFETPAEYSFNHNMAHKDCLTCMSSGSQNLSFSRCGHCEQFYCFNHFFGTDPDTVDYHMCYS